MFDWFAQVEFWRFLPPIKNNDKSTGIDVISVKAVCGGKYLWNGCGWREQLIIVSQILDIISTVFFPLLVSGRLRDQ